MEVFPRLVIALLSGDGDYAVVRFVCFCILRCMYLQRVLGLRLRLEIGPYTVLLNCGTLFTLQSSTSIDALLRIVVLCVLTVGECQCIRTIMVVVYVSTLFVLIVLLFCMQIFSSSGSDY